MFNKLDIFSVNNDSFLNNPGEVKMDEFLKLFQFDPDKHLMVGAERECFLVNGTGAIAPIAKKVLDYLTVSETFGYELSACQLEDRMGPCWLEELPDRIQRNDMILRAAEEKLGFRCLYLDVAPDDMPLDVYPDPTGRYQRIVKTMSKETLLSACQVTGLHLHIGMRDHQSALTAYNYVVEHFDEISSQVGPSGQRRLAIYKKVAGSAIPQTFSSWDDFYQKALAEGFSNDPRKCWTFVRISIHGTIEFRLFSTTGSAEEIYDKAKKCHDLCQRAFIS